jgi:hypothetical protein
MDPRRARVLLRIAEFTRTLDRDAHQVTHLSGTELLDTKEWKKMERLFFKTLVHIVFRDFMALSPVLLGPDELHQTQRAVDVVCISHAVKLALAGQNKARAERNPVTTKELHEMLNSMRGVMSSKHAPLTARLEQPWQYRRLLAVASNDYACSLDAPMLRREYANSTVLLFRRHYHEGLHVYLPHDDFTWAYVDGALRECE